jgi:hypothetical protein
MFQAADMTTIDLREIPTFWINLDKDMGRRARMESMFVQLEMDHNKRISGYQANTVKEGCGKAQEKTLKKIRKYPTLVLEDDCVQTEHFIPIINIPTDADAIYLGCSHWGMNFNTGRNGPIAKWQAHGEKWLRVTNMLATHAILYLNPEFHKACQDIIHKYVYEIHDHIDIGYCSILKDFNIYTPKEPFFYQSSSESVTRTSLTRKLSGRIKNNSIIDNHKIVSQPRPANQVSPNIKKQRRVAGTQGGYRPILNNPTGRIRRKGR